jgi:hypothetical protein
VPRRPPPFALVLTVLVALAALAIVLVGGGSSRHPAEPEPRQPPTIGLGTTRACQTTRASARVTAQSAIVITATATAPVRVTERATGPRGTASVTRSAALTARLRVSEPVKVADTALAQARACGRGASPTAARALAVRRAYADALNLAQARAGAAADKSLHQLIRSRYPTALAQAQARANAEAHRLAVAAAAKLAAQAQTEAARQAGA